jgi:putative ABC transport system permease protein
MMLWESFRIALISLRANKMRSFLTMLGIIIGVASLITMVGVGAGAQTKVADQIRSVGANVLMVVPGTAREGGARKESGSGHTLTESDARAIAKQIPQVQVAAPSIRGASQIVRGNKNWNTIINGTNADYFIARDWNLARGRNFSKSEEEGAGKVAVLGATVAKELFGSDDPIGQEIRISSVKQVPEANTSKRQQSRISSVPFNVIGVLAEKGSSGTGKNQDDIVFVPISTAKLRLMGSPSQVNRDSVAYILVKAVSDEGAMAAAEDATEALLKQRHQIGVDRENDFEVINPAEIMATQQAATNTFAWLLAAIASVALVVGGISIMNIMLVSVTERTREIGLRLAVGARRRDIRNQFLTEAVSLCLLGGVIGVGVGTVAAWTVAKLASWPVFLGPEAMLFAAGFAAAIGIFFGYYPARKAAKLEPVVALRSE